MHPGHLVLLETLRSLLVGNGRHRFFLGDGYRKVQSDFDAIDQFLHFGAELLDLEFLVLAEGRLDDLVHFVQIHCHIVKI